MTDGLESVRHYWDQHAGRDPLWAILSDPAKREGKWDVGRFFQTGTDEIATLFYELERLGVVPEPGAAMDFGCGVGRLTQALALRFDRVIGVDVSPRMLELADGLNRFPQKVFYVSNSTADLQSFRDKTFDFIVSLIVLQHVEPPIALRYLREFFRALKPGGVLVFQLPSHARPADSRPVGPMPDDAYRASLIVRECPAGRLTPGAGMTLQIDVTNVSTFTWTPHGHGPIRIGNHWLDATGERMLLRDDGRTAIPGELGPGACCTLPLTVTAPAAEGDYICEIDVAHEGVLWFRDKGSAAVRLNVRVGQRDDRGSAVGKRGPASGPSGDPPRDVPLLVGRAAGAADPGDFPMHGIHTDIIDELIASQGASLLRKETDRAGGDEWMSYRYFVRNRI